jgi:hypothetical protein
VTITFSAKISSVNVERSEGETVDSGKTTTFDLLGWTSTVRASGTFSTTTKTRSSATRTTEYSYDMVCKAQQDEMPPGMKKMLSILEEAILHVDS